MKETSENGLIEIKILEKAEFIEVMVKDNGLGMTEEQIEEVYSVQEDEHIGFSNVIKRLQLLYHRDIRELISIESQLNKETTLE